MPFPTILKNFAQLESSDWNYQAQNNRLFAINNFTGDQFTYDRMQINSEQMNNNYKSRGSYTLPNTPQIMLACTQSQSNCIQFFAQCPAYGLEKLIKRNNCENSLKQLFKSVIKTIQTLVKKYGYFQLTPNMLRVSNSLNYLVWINQNFGATHRQYPLGSTTALEDCKLMIGNLFSIFQAAGGKKLLQNLRLRVENQNVKSFQKLKLIIDTCLRCSSKQFPKSSKSNYSPPKFLRRDSSPYNSRMNSKSIPKSRSKASCNAGSAQVSGLKLRDMEQSLSQMDQSSMKLNSTNIYLKRNSTQIFNNSPIRNKHSKSMVFNLLQVPYRGQAVVSSETCLHDPEMNETNKKQQQYRQSQKSVTTAPYLSSASSSGKYRNINFEDIRRERQEQKLYIKGLQLENLLEKTQKKQKYFNDIHGSIIEDYNEELATPINKTDIDRSFGFSDYEADFHAVMAPHNSESLKPSTTFTQLQKELHNIL